MKQTISSSKTSPKQLALNIISILPSRSQVIMKKRFGLTNNHPQTLQEVGNIYGITRERVRQIVEASLKIIKKSPVFGTAKDFWKKIISLLEKSGGIEEEGEFFTRLEKEIPQVKGNEAAVKFLLFLSPDVAFEKEDKGYHSFWRLSNRIKEEIMKRMKKMERYFSEQKSPLSFKDVLQWARKSFVPSMEEAELAAYLKISRKIGMNPFGEYGLFVSSEIEPLGTKDRAYVMMKHHQKPSHFSEISKLINENKSKKLPVSPTLLSSAWLKQVKVQTVHNELIKDKRFVLIGRGIYALREWGYKPGRVVDVIKEVLKKAGRPLSQEEIIKKVKKQRLAKDNTIILNLHNKKFFKKLPNKRYTLVRPYKVLEG